ncbi:DinB family protein [Mesobacillus jeotgali]|uniref:DinB family protein n=1 Tax=Mesobacillus jeotgali TaxID=129985 RepID=A0ABY9VJQ9_9BACI|nr:DinB family protein [Mesobacillus jeotgali]WNF24192.1 DinB family protein [Mesobacillus jeotgali]
MVLDRSQLFLIDEKEGFGPTFSHLVSMMNYVRSTTLEAVEGLTIEELDFLIHDGANSIGMLLAHMAAVERIYQIVTFEKRDPTAEEEEALAAGLDLGEKGKAAFNGFPLEHYLADLEAEREDTYRKFGILSDDWLFEQTDWWWGEPGNNYFKWFHVFEDEINHRGQIRMIKKIHSLQKEHLAK